jgi:hypothetical protein
MLTLADGLVGKFQSAKMRDMPYDGAEYMVAVQRKLIYTEHWCDHRTARCQDCGTERRYGA